MAATVALCITKDFDTLPEETRKLLFTLAEGEAASKGVAFGVTIFYNQLPKDVLEAFIYIS